MFRTAFLITWLLSLNCGYGRHTQLNRTESNAPQCEYKVEDITLYSKTTCSLRLWWCKMSLHAVGSLRQRNQYCHFKGISISELGYRTLFDSEIDQILSGKSPDPEHLKRMQDDKFGYAHWRKEIPVSKISLKPIFSYIPGDTSAESAHEEKHVFDIEYSREVSDPWGRYATEVFYEGDRRLIWHGVGK